MRLHRFFITQPLGEELVVHDKDVLSQWCSVFRYTAGNDVIIGNGILPVDYTYRFLSLSKKEATLNLVSSQEVYTESLRDIILCMSLIKKDKLELVVQKGVELGVKQFIIFSAERSEAKNIDTERMYRIAREALEQCGRVMLPHFTFVKSTQEAISLVSSLCETKHMCVLHMTGIPISDYMESVPFDASLKKTLYIGPEGGWTSAEEFLFTEKGIASVSLTPTILRAETAAMASLSYMCMCK